MLHIGLTFLAQVSGAMLLPAAIPGMFVALLRRPFVYPVSALLATAYMGCGFPLSFFWAWSPSMRGSYMRLNLSE